MSRPLRRFFALLLLVLASLPAGAASRLPAWLQEARKINNPRIEQRVDAVVLLDDREYTYMKDGNRRITFRYAMRIQQTDGRQKARLKESYDNKAVRIRNLKIWVIRADGSVETFSKRDCVQASNPDQLYTENMTIAFSGFRRVRPGDTFAYELEFRGKTIFTHSIFPLQRDIPVLLARLRLQPPRGWEARSITVNGNEIIPRMEDGYYIWEARNIRSFNSREGLLPDPCEFALTLIVGARNPGVETGRFPYLSFDNWNEVAAYGASIMEPQMVPDDTIRKKALQLTAGLDDPWQKMTAIARFAQAIRYVSIAMNLELGGGMIPFPASEVLRCNYGDCKDKAILMRSLLAAIGITSYSVIINSDGPREKVQVDWPSGSWFNHCIIGIAVSPEVNAEAVINHPQLGRLLIFDPTNPVTPFGEFSPNEYGNQCLVLSPYTQELSDIPELGPERNRIENHVEASLDEFGNFKVRLEHVSTGRQALSMRHLCSTTTKSGLEGVVRERLSDDASLMMIKHLEAASPDDTGTFNMTVEAEFIHYAKDISHRLLVFKPALFWRLEWTPPDRPRRSPLKFKSHTYQETTEIHLPEGYSIDEIADSLQLDATFASYSSEISHEAGKIILKRTLVMREMLLPREDYDQVLSFYKQVVGNEQTPVVLKRDAS